MPDHTLTPEHPERAERGAQVFHELLGGQAGATTPMRAAARDFIFSEVWTRPGLDRRARFWISLTCACAAQSPIAMTAYMQMARHTGLATIEELREFALQFACYQGFPRATAIDALIDALEAGEISKTPGER